MVFARHRIDEETKRLQTRYNAKKISRPAPEKIFMLLPILTTPYRRSSARNRARLDFTSSFSAGTENYYSSGTMCRALKNWLRSSNNRVLTKEGIGITSSVASQNPTNVLWPRAGDCRYLRKGTNMDYKTLGNTGLLVSRLCLGTMTFGGAMGARARVWKTIGAVDQKGADELVKAAVEAGINLFDTADVYSDGESEQTLGQSLKNLNIARKDVVIATKVFGRVGPGRNDVGASRGHIMDAIDASLRRLQTDHIDLYQIHANDSVTPVEETLNALDTLVQQGKVRYIGVSNWQAWKIAKALGISESRNLSRFVTLQAYYSIAGRDLEREIVSLLEAEKIGLLVWSPLAGGLLSGKFSRNNQKAEGARRSEFDFPIVDKERAWRILDVMAPIAKTHGCSPARVALAWLLTKPVITSVIIGAKRIEQLQDNLAAVELKLTDDELRQLDDVSALPPEYPGWMLPFQSADRLDPSIQRF
jgi:aryl-alcohol dehydrogenase-like predicted oxidoreductase